MQSHLALGIFAFYVVAVALCRLLSERLPARLSALQKIWGRHPGLLLYFVAHVALPLVIGILYIGQGVLDFRGETDRATLAPVHHRYSIPHLYPRPPIPPPQPAEVLYNGEIAVLLIPPVVKSGSAPERAYTFWANSENLQP